VCVCVNAPLGFSGTHRWHVERLAENAARSCVPGGGRGGGGGCGGWLPPACTLHNALFR